MRGFARAACRRLACFVEVVENPVFVAAREHSKRDDAHACEFGRAKIAEAPRVGNAAAKGCALSEGTADRWRIGRYCA